MAGINDASELPEILTLLRFGARPGSQQAQRDPSRRLSPDIPRARNQTPSRRSKATNDGLKAKNAEINTANKHLERSYRGGKSQIRTCGRSSST